MASLFIFCRYLKSTFVVDLLGCLPWDLLYKVIPLADKPKFHE
jgi:hypothetical protein